MVPVALVPGPAPLHATRQRTITTDRGTEGALHRPMLPVGASVDMEPGVRCAHDPRSRSPRSASPIRAVTLTQLMEVTDANIAGNVHGGVVMRLGRHRGRARGDPHAGGLAVTVAIDEMTFLEPVHIGDCSCSEPR